MIYKTCTGYLTISYITNMIKPTKNESCNINLYKVTNNKEIGGTKDDKKSEK